MFLLALNERQSTAFLRRPWLSIGVGCALVSLAALFGGLSLYLVAAFVVPILECALRYGFRRQVPKAALLPAAVTVFVAHAAFLAFMQDGAVGVEKLAVNIAYVFTVLVGAGVGALMFQNAITAAERRAQV